ncbi:MAG: gliding motility lipoprotein GldH [Bacteroidales bacterium]
MERKKISTTITVLATLLIVYSCNPDRIYNESTDLKNAKWDTSNVLSYRFNIEDTINAHHVFFYVRHTSEYQYQNLYLFVETTSPEGFTVKDTLELMLANDKGQWYGKGWGDVFEVSVPYKEYVRFPKSGTYTIDIQQGMRANPLKHVTDFGIQIEKAKISEQ